MSVSLHCFLLPSFVHLEDRNGAFQYNEPYRYSGHRTSLYLRVACSYSMRKIFVDITIIYL